MDMLALAIDSYRLDYGRLPSELIDLLVADDSPKWHGPYLHRPYINDSWGHRLRYTVLDSAHYDLRSLGPDGVEGTTDDMVYGKE
jgi:hypothetical protein